MTAFPPSAADPVRASHFATSIFFACAPLETGNPVGDGSFIALEADLDRGTQPGLGQRGKVFFRASAVPPK